jgi:hypothetical protein
MSDFPHIDMVTDWEDYEFIKAQSLRWIKALEKEIASGKTPDQIADHWGDARKRDAWKLRLLGAARHIFNERIGN